jgi:asparagine synthase (glutamine-hydrolysing)
MALQIKARGPDDSGVWAEDGIAVAHRRLAVIDLSPAGHQPMVSACNRLVLAFNGEIYNHQTLRTDLHAVGAGVNWRGNSDTETLIAGFAHWGVAETLKRTVGMFALALWDRDASVLTLARDRLGEKPLYFGWQGEDFLFGSDLKAFRVHPAFRAEIDRHAVGLFVQHGYVPAPHCIYRGVQKLLPGTWLTLRRGDSSWHVGRYWSFKDSVERGRAAPFEGNESEAVDCLQARLSEAVRGQMASDVPLGAFLSGGVDSSTIVALMQAQSSRPIRTFSIGFHEQGDNEAEYAKAVARHLGTDHTELYVNAQQALAVVPKLPELYSEPFADSSQIPTYLVAEMARKQVTVALSGDGGDELFCGYNRYRIAEGAWKQFSRLPTAARRAAAGVLLGLPAARWDALMAAPQTILPARFRHGGIGAKLHKLAGILDAPDGDALYQRLSSPGFDPAEIVVGYGASPGSPDIPVHARRKGSLAERMMESDTLSYLPDDILVKVDRAAMGVSLETRVPLLDHRVVEFAWQLPLGLKYRIGVSKWPLRQILYRHVPRQLIERPKMGFAMPVGSWLRGELRAWAEDLLDESRLKREGYFHAAPIRRKWAEHLSGRRNWEQQLWSVLMFQQWLAAPATAGKIDG